MRRDSCHGLQVLTALQFIPPLSVRGGWNADIHHIVSRGLIMGGALSNLLLRYDAVDFCFYKDGREMDRSAVFPHLILLLLLAKQDY